jgi:PAS domain S-box-containing protein
MSIPNKLTSGAMGSQSHASTMLLDDLPLGLAYFDRALRCVRLNAEFALLYQCNVETAIGAVIDQLMPQIAEQLRPLIAQVFASGVGQRDIEVTEYSPLDSALLRHALVSVSPVLADGTATTVAVVVHDISERKRAEEAANKALYHSEARYRSLVETSAQVVWRADAQGHLFDRRLRWSKVTDIPLTELPPEPLDLVHPDDRAQGSQAWWQAVQRVEAISFEQRVRGADGTYHTWQVRGAPVLEADGQVREWVGTDTDITARRQAEQALRESAQQLRLITDGMPALISYVDRQRRYRFVNKAYSEWFGLRNEAVVGHYMWEVLGEAAYAAARPHIDEALAGHGVTYERVLPYQHGGARFVQATYIPEHAPDGSVNGFFVLVVDLTERKQAEDRLRYQSQLLDALTGSILDGILVVSPEGRILHYNQQFLDIWAFPPEILASQSDERALDWAAEQTADPVAFRSRVTMIYEQYAHQFREEVLMRDGRIYERFGAAIQDGERRLGWLWTFRDITERKQAEAALRAAQAQRLAEEQQQAERLRQLNTAALAIIAAPNRDEILRLIATWARTLIDAKQAVVNLVADDNWAESQMAVSLAEPYHAWQEYRAEITGAGIYRLVYNEQRPLRLTQAELLAHPDWREFSGEHAHHPPLKGLLAVPIINSDGTSIGVLQISDKATGTFTPPDEALLVQLAQLAAVALENQTLYEQEQAARAQAEEASRLKDDFLATVSHELRTPLTAFLGYAQMLQMRQRDAAYINRTVEKMVRSAKVQAQLIEDLLDIARVVSGRLRIEPGLVDLQVIISAALDTVRPTIEVRGLLLEIDLHPVASTVVGDANRLQQVVWNLLTNAAKFTEPGGKITVLLRADEQHAIISVRDTGQGISASFLPYVFDRFRQADVTSNRTNTGLGIGLAIVRYLVELHGGQVEVQSDGLGHGATFTVRLPLASSSTRGTWPTQASTFSAVPHDCPPALVGLRVLVVDDQAEVRELIEEILTSCGAVVLACSNAQEALDAVRHWQPQVLMSDIAMPGEDGYWLITQVRALAASEGGSVPALALTAYARLEDRLQVLASGFEQYVSKPVDPSELRAIVAQLVQRDA